ncbi:MAG: hypothetical protein IJQ68_08240 [Methanobrevibacter sp.]|uniref:hypothetical protein n=1 Tax=Methanobrevibacter sp. TaxID=66852 RepID=UPI0025F6EB15|nr:hypothetical protein [Methanobrevibacter sp.]MBR0271959.1 hypothetical protein [Methanobrevibacter sp.]
MEYIERISNINFRNIIGKSHKFNRNILNELKRCVFIHHCTDNGDDTFSCTYSKYKNEEVLYFFTDLDEYYKCYSENEKNTIPMFWDFAMIYDLLYDNLSGIIINPKTENFFIPSDVLFHILADELEIKNELESQLEIFNDDILARKKIYTPEELFHIEDLRKNRSLEKYLKNKKRLNRLDNLFSYFKHSHLYAIAQYDEKRDFEGDWFKVEWLEYYKKDNCIVVFMDLDSLKNEVKDYDMFCYYGVADMLNITEIVLRDDWEGIIVNTGEQEFKLNRKLLIKHYDSLRLNQYDFELDNASKYIFKLE